MHFLIFSTKIKNIHERQTRVHFISDEIEFSLLIIYFIFHSLIPLENVGGTYTYYRVIHNAFIVGREKMSCSLDYCFD